MCCKCSNNFSFRHGRRGKNAATYIFSCFALTVFQMNAFDKMTYNPPARRYSAGGLLFLEATDEAPPVHLDQCQPYGLGKQRRDGVAYRNALGLLAAMEEERVGERLQTGKLAQGEHTRTTGVDVAVAVGVGDRVGRTVPKEAAKSAVVARTVVFAGLQRLERLDLRGTVLGIYLTEDHVLGSIGQVGNGVADGDIAALGKQRGGIEVGDVCALAALCKAMPDRNERSVARGILL